jgi:hypothetical protein
LDCFRPGPPGQNSSRTTRPALRLIDIEVSLLFRDE